MWEAFEVFKTPLFSFFTPPQYLPFIKGNKSPVTVIFIMPNKNYIF